MVLFVSLKQPVNVDQVESNAKMRSAAIHMFPNRKMLIELYPRAGKYIALTPFLFVYQMLSFPVKKICSGVLKRDIRSEASEINRESQKRIDMFRKLDML